MKKYIYSFLALIGLTVIVLGLHYFILQSLEMNNLWSETNYSLWGIYGFQWVVSVVVIIIMGLLADIMPQWVGFVFLGLMTLKLIFNYIYIAAGLEGAASEFLKYNYFAAFVCYFIFDVFIAYRAINQGEEPAVDKK